MAGREGRWEWPKSGEGWREGDGRSIVSAVSE